MPEAAQISFIIILWSLFMNRLQNVHLGGGLQLQMVILISGAIFWCESA